VATAEFFPPGTECHNGLPPPPVLGRHDESDGNLHIKIPGHLLTIYLEWYVIREQTMTQVDDWRL